MFQWTCAIVQWVLEERRRKEKWIVCTKLGQKTCLSQSIHFGLHSNKQLNTCDNLTRSVQRQRTGGKWSSDLKKFKVLLFKHLLHAAFIWVGKYSIVSVKVLYSIYPLSSHDWLIEQYTEWVWKCHQVTFVNGKGLGELWVTLSSCMYSFINKVVKAG